MKNIHRAWAVCLGCTLALLVCGGLCINAFSVTQPYILAQNGFTNTQTSMITTACSVTFLLCMFVANAYYEKLGYRVGLTLAVLLGACLIAGLIFCTLAGIRSTALMLLATILFGVGIPLSTVGLSVWAADFCEEAQRPRRIQRFQLLYAAGGLAFSFMPGAIADLTGSYAPAYIVFTLFAIFTLAVVQSTYRLERRSAV